MKKLLTIIALLFSLTAVGQSPVPESLVSAARMSQSEQTGKVKSVSIFIDGTSNKTKKDLQEIMKGVNDVYFQANIQFKVELIVKSQGNYNPDHSLEKSIYRLYNINDVTVYVTGSHSGDLIGIEFKDAILVDLQGSNHACIGIIAHELGHTFGLKHGDNSSYIMSVKGNKDYCNKFTKENLNILSH